MNSIAERLKERRKALKLTQGALAKRSGVSQTTIADLERGRNKGSTQLANIAKVLDCDALWLATGKEAPARHAAMELASYEVEKSNIIPQYDDVRGAMGRGVMLRDQPGQITGWQVTDEWIVKNVPSNTGKKHLCIVTGFGDSMVGMFNSGDPLLVDTGIKSVEFDAVYFFRIGNEGFIKRLQRIPGEGLRVISKNKDYETWTIKPDMDFEVFARVIKVWTGSDL